MNGWQIEDFSVLARVYIIRSKLFGFGVTIPMRIRDCDTNED